MKTMNVDKGGITLRVKYMHEIDDEYNENYEC